MSGLVLAGGLSRRMGQPKALLEWQGKSLVHWQALKLQQVCQHVGIASDHPFLPNLPFESFPDAKHGCGPLGGIVAGMRRSTAEAILVLAVDLPGVKVSLLRALQNAFEPDDSILMPVAEERAQPLCAIWHCVLLPSLEEALKEGEHKIMQLAARAGARMLPIASLQPPVEEVQLFNVNLPQDWRLWQAQHAQENESDFLGIVQ